MLDFFSATLTNLQADSEMLPLVASVRHLVGTQDLDLRWALARVSFAIGHPSARDPPDTSEILARVQAVQLIEAAKSERYVRIGDPFPPKTFYIIVAVWPSPQGDRAFLFPSLPAGHNYTLDPTAPAVCLHGQPVPWPPFEPPLLAHIASKVDEVRNGSGFVYERLVVSGDAKLPPPVSPHAHA